MIRLTTSSRHERTTVVTGRQQVVTSAGEMQRAATHPLSPPSLTSNQLGDFSDAVRDLSGKNRKVLLVALEIRGHDGGGSSSKEERKKNWT